MRGKLLKTGVQFISGNGLVFEHPVEKPKDSMAGNGFRFGQLAQCPIAGKQHPRICLGKSERETVGKRERWPSVTTAKCKGNLLAIQLFDAKPHADVIGAAMGPELTFVQ